MNQERNVKCYPNSQKECLIQLVDSFFLLGFDTVFGGIRSVMLMVCKIEPVGENI